MIESVLNVFAIIGITISVASTIVLSLERIAEVTPSTKDDKYVAKVKKWLGFISYVLDPINIYTTKDKR